jgi:hypothetical protein
MTGACTSASNAELRVLRKSTAVRWSLAMKRPSRTVRSLAAEPRSPWKRPGTIWKGSRGATRLSMGAMGLARAVRSSTAARVSPASEMRARACGASGARKPKRRGSYSSKRPRSTPSAGPPSSAAISGATDVSCRSALSKARLARTAVSASGALSAKIMVRLSSL